VEVNGGCWHIKRERERERDKERRRDETCWECMGEQKNRGIKIISTGPRM
jgi:hypothetical protein